jgi:hypothetical protein
MFLFCFVYFIYFFVIYFYLAAQINELTRKHNAHFNPVTSFDCQAKTAVTVVVSLLQYATMTMMFVRNKTIC